VRKEQRVALNVSHVHVLLHFEHLVFFPFASPAVFLAGLAPDLLHVPVHARGQKEPVFKHAFGKQLVHVHDAAHLLVARSAHVPVPRCVELSAVGQRTHRPEVVFTLGFVGVAAPPGRLLQRHPLRALHIKQLEMLIAIHDLETNHPKKCGTDKAQIQRAKFFVFNSNQLWRLIREQAIETKCHFFKLLFAAVIIFNVYLYEYRLK